MRWLADAAIPGVTDHMRSPDFPASGYTGWRAGWRGGESSNAPGGLLRSLASKSAASLAGRSAMTTQRIFVSHSHEDNGFCHKLVEALGTTSTDVWFDEQKLGPGQLLLTIERELRACPIFVVILSPAALASDWVRDESSWAYILQRREPHRVILPVLAQPVDANAIWLFLQGFKRIEAPGGLPLTAAEAGRQTLRAITLPLSNPAVEQQKHVHDGSSGALLARARALYAGNRHAEALAVLDRA